MMKYLLILLSVLFLITGCASPTPYYQYHNVPHLANNLHYKIIPIYMDNTFSKEEIATINLVVAEWNYVLNGQMKISISKGTFNHNNEAHVKAILDRLSNTGEGFMLLGVNHNDKLITEYMKQDTSGKILAFCDHVGDDKLSGLYVIRDRIGMRNLHQILLHEFGHALGSEHVNAYSLMFPHYGAGEPDCIDKVTAAQVAGYQGIHLSAMNYCAIPNFE